MRYGTTVLSGIMALVVLGAMTGCETIRTSDINLRFNDTLRVYGQALRWGDFQRAASFSMAPGGGALEVGASPPAGLQVTSVSLEPRFVAEDSRSAVVDLQIDYVPPASNSVRTVRDTQNWWYDDEARRWFLDGGLPDLGGGSGP